MKETWVDRANNTFTIKQKESMRLQATTATRREKEANSLSLAVLLLKQSEIALCAMSGQEKGSCQHEGFPTDPITNCVQETPLQEERDN